MSDASSQPKPAAKPVTRKTYLETVAKVKRLNYKLSQVEKIALLMEQVSNSGDTVPAKQVQSWVRALKRELGKTSSASSADVADSSK